MRWTFVSSIDGDPLYGVITNQVHSPAGVWVAVCCVYTVVISDDSVGIPVIGTMAIWWEVAVKGRLVAWLV